MGRFVIRYKDTGLDFELQDNEGHPIATSQTYASIVTCKRAIRSIKACASVAQIEYQDHICKHPKFEIYKNEGFARAPVFYFTSYQMQGLWRRSFWSQVCLAHVLALHRSVDSAQSLFLSKTLADRVRQGHQSDAKGCRMTPLLFAQPLGLRSNLRARRRLKR